MPLSAPVARQHLHTRNVECRGYFRADGLWDIEGHITDLKTYNHQSGHRGALTPSDPVHEMWIRLTLDEDYVIHDVEAVTDHAPYRPCPEITPNFKRLIGLRIGRGFHRAARERVGGIQGCTHLVELLGPVATVAFQTLFADRAKRLMREYRRQNGLPDAPPADRSRKPLVLDTCHAWAADGEVIQRVYPEFYTGPKAPAETESN